MSASSGILAKGEKGKSKFQSLDINNLYKSTENEPTQQKGSLLRTKNGMQSLGKVPTARRPPANLPSLKSENSGNEPAVSLVPAGAAGWGSKPGETPPPSQQQPSQAPPVMTVPAVPAPAPVAVVTPVVMVPPPHEQALHNLMPGPDKSWSAIMARDQTPNFLAHQSPQFQHEFPKLASEGGVAPPGKPVDAQYGPGPSLRPQTEGSWTSGGGRPLSGGGAAPAGPPPSLGPAHHGPEPGPGAVRNNLAPHPPVAAPMGPAGPVGPTPPLPVNFPYRPLQHPFMMHPRPGFPGGQMAGMRPRYPFPPGGRAPEPDEPITRPIIRDEELNKMDEMSRDPGWAASEDIDYNEKLAFSDGEDGPLGDSKRRDRKDRTRGKDDEKERVDRDMDRRSERAGDKRGDWGRPRGYAAPLEEDRRATTEEERIKLRDMEDERRKMREDEEDRRKVREEVATAVQVARQRKDEAKRFDEPKRNDRREWDEGNKRDIPERDEIKREHNNKRDVNVPRGMYDRDNKSEQKRDEPKRDEHKFENKRDDRDGKRDDGKRDEHGYRGRVEDRRDFRRPAQYSKLPPRLQAQADRLNSQHRQTSSPQPASNANSYDQPHWGHGRRYGSEPSDDTRERHTSDSRDRHTPDTYNDRYKGTQRDRHYHDDSRRHFDRKERDSDSDRHSEDSYKKREVEHRGQKDVRKEPSEERDAWRSEDERRPQRPDSRDSRASRDSRHSREDKNDSDHKSRTFQTPEVEMQRDELPKSVTPAPREEVTPPRENHEVVVDDKKPAVKHDSPAVTSTAEVHSPSSEDRKDDKDEKSPLDDRHKNKSSRGRWGSGSTGSSTYVRNGNRGERRRRVSGAAKQDVESCSSGEGGSELDKGEKEERNRETKRSSTGEATGRDGFAPSGQPSRRGRGSARARGRMDGYGPPPLKASFPQNEPPAVEEEAEDPTKQKQAALNAGIVGGAARAAAAAAAPPTKSDKPSPPKVNRSQSQREVTRGKPSRGGRRTVGRNGVDGEDWETMSNSDVEDRKGDGRSRRGGGSNRGPPRPYNNRTGTRAPALNADIKEEKAGADVGKVKSADGESDTTQSSGAGPDSRPKKDVTRKNGPNEGKSDHGPRSGLGKDRDRQDRMGDRRGKPTQNPPPAPNPNGPQPLMSQVVNPPPQMKNYSSSTWRQTTVLPPRLQKQQEQRLQANANTNANSDSHDLQKPSTNNFLPKNDMQPNAWDKPLGPRSAPLPLPNEQNIPVPEVNARSSPAAAPCNKMLPTRPDTLLDDTAPPVQTIIFENTNLKTGAPPAFAAGMKPAAVRVTKGNEWKAGDELFAKGGDLSGSETVVPEHNMKPQPPLYAEHGLDLLNSELSEMTEENAADLKHRLAGTKQLWDKKDDEPPSNTVFSGSFCQDAGIDGSVFSKPVDGVVVSDDCSSLMHSAEVVYPVSQTYGMSKHDHTNSNVCKVKPQQQPVLTSGHSPLGHTGQSPLSPPPYSSAQGQFNYAQAGLGGSGGQYSGMSAIPSPPAGHPYSSQPLQQNAGLFTPFPLERNQFNTQFSAPYGLSAGLGGTSSYNQAPMYMPHAAPHSDVFSTTFRVQHASHTNPSAVLMASSGSSLISASVKQPSSQNIGVIGSKGPTYQQSIQQFIPYDAMPLGGYLGSGMVQRSTPVQQATTNFYANSAAPQTGFYGTSNAGLGQPMASLQQPYSRQGYLNQSANLQGYSSQPQVHMDIGYRNPGSVGPSYLKSGVGNNATMTPTPDVLASVFNSAPPKTRPQKQMSQPPPQQSPTQMSVNKFGNYSSSQLSAPPPQTQVQQQQMGQQRMAGPQNNMGLAGVRSAPRYPTPIQRPLNYRGARPNAPHHNRTGKPFFDAQDGKLDEGDMNSVDETSAMNCESKMADVATSGKSDGTEEPVPVSTE